MRSCEPSGATFSGLGRETLIGGRAGSTGLVAVTASVALGVLRASIHRADL